MFTGSLLGDTNSITNCVCLSLSHTNTHTYSHTPSPSPSHLLHFLFVSFQRTKNTQFLLNRKWSWFSENRLSCVFWCVYLMLNSQGRSSSQSLWQQMLAARPSFTHLQYAMGHADEWKKWRHNRIKDKWQVPYDISDKQLEDLMNQMCLSESHSE